MTSSLTDQLCTQCGLCCDGTLLADVELASRKEAASMEALGMPMDEDAEGNVMQQPCVALKRKKCTIYAQRPISCRAFECNLLLDVRAGKVSVTRAVGHIQDAFARIERVKTLLAELGDRNSRLPLKERCADVVSCELGSTPMRSELESAMTLVESLIHRVFLQ